MADELELQLSDDSYKRWLRARQPQYPIPFFELTPEEQETLAQHGDAYTHDVLVAVAYAVRNPEAAAMSLEGGSPEAEEALVTRMAALVARRAENAPGSPLMHPPLTMGGTSKRRLDRIHADQVAANQGKTFMGRPPDPAPAVRVDGYQPEVEELLA